MRWFNAPAPLVVGSLSIWRARSRVDHSVTSATITVEQPEGTLVLTVQCTFSAPTSNGQVARQAVSCTSS